MSTTLALMKLKEDQRKIKESLKDLETQKKEIDDKYFTVLNEENKLHKELRECRDTYQYSQLEIRINSITKRRREVESQKQELERKVRGYQEELEKINARIEYMKPKGELVSKKLDQD